MEEKEFNSINVIPLVDIMLVLLTIVLVTATFIVEGTIPVKLPVASSSKTTNVKTYKIILTRKGEIFFENKKLSLKDLSHICSAIASQNPNISIFADQKATVQQIVKILDVLKKYKIKKVFIKTRIK